MLQQYTMLHALIHIFKMPSIDGVRVKDLPQVVTKDLIEVGFDKYTIAKAINWLVELALNQQALMFSAPSPGSIRVYRSQELYILSGEGCQYLYVLEKRGVLDSVSRELVLDRLLALEGVGIDRQVIKFVVIMVLSNLSKGVMAASHWFALEDSPHFLQ